MWRPLELNESRRGGVGQLAFSRQTDEAEAEHEDLGVSDQEVSNR